jgi:hypothetical protein
MQKDVFRYFIRINYPNLQTQITNEDCDEIGKSFSDYLKDNLKEDVIIKIVPKDAIDFITNSEHPLKMNGFHPALLLHFYNFIKKMKEEQIS